MHCVSGTIVCNVNAPMVTPIKYTVKVSVFRDFCRFDNPNDHI